MANKCSIATRIDCFMDESTSVFGEALRDQVEERLKFYEEGTVPRANELVMKEALEKTVKMDLDDEEVPSPKKDSKEKKSKKKKSKAQEEDADMTEASPVKKRKAEDESKKSKKKKNKEKN